MGIFDFDDEEEKSEEEENVFLEEDFEENEYLKDPSRAIGLISKVIPRERHNLGTINRLKKINSLLDEELLGALKYVRLNQEAHVQMELTALAKKIHEERKYNVLKNKAIVGIGGKFSAGKSGLINSLLHVDKLLPEDQNPTTSIATYIVKGDCRKIVVYTAGNSESEIDVEALNALTHNFYERYRIGFSSFINCVIVNESEMPYENIVFLDTPGYSKADIFQDSEIEKNKSDANKALMQLSGVDHLIWLIDIENGEISVQDINFIKKVNIDTPILFVLNKADKKDDDEISSIIDKVKTTLIANGINLYDVTAYSKYDGEWNQQGVLSNFLEMISQEKKSKLDVCNQISEIVRKIELEIEQALDGNKQEINELYNIIAESNTITETKSLVDVYCEKLEEQRNIMRCENLLDRNIEELDRLIKMHYGG